MNPRIARRFIVPVALLALLAFAALAVAAGGGVIVKSTRNASLGRTIVVDAKGRTLYRLSGDTAAHLKCTASCLGFWPPLTVPSRKTALRAGPGVHGRLAILRRSNGVLQVTLRGLPLYRFMGDSAKGQAKGQGIKGFGGTWSVVSPSAAAGATPAAPKPSPYPTY
jgi:predicted lipoprotein with Yx(FWY)xxD motif